MSFSTLGLSQPILDAVTDAGYTSPSPIQAQAIPAVLKGRDIMAAAQTGTGKTAAFALPIIELLSTGPAAKSNQIRSLVLTPTRELAAQVHENFRAYSVNHRLRCEVVFGGVKINPQMMRLRGGADVVVATPGRLLDLYNQNAIRFDRLEILVLDEADRMLDMGFIHDIKRILKLLPPERQNLLFSATFSTEIRQLAKGLVNDPVEISVTPPNSTVKAVKQWLCPVDKKQKSPLLRDLIAQNRWDQVLVFSRTKHGANKLAKYLDESGIKAVPIHGNKSQGARTRALADFKQGKVQVLVATDIAARGLDIDQLPYVVNFDLPNVPEDYVHRIGRTGRAGATGEAVSLVCADEIKQLQDIERLIKKLIPREYVDGYEPVHELPESRSPMTPAKKPKKPKKPKTSTPTSHSTGAGSGNSRSEPRQQTGLGTPSTDRARGDKVQGGRRAGGSLEGGNLKEGPADNTARKTQRPRRRHRKPKLS